MAPSKDRVKKYREKLKNNKEKYAKHLEEERQRDKIRREVAKKTEANDSSALKLKRLKEKERKQLYRAKNKVKKITGNTPEKGSYMSANSFGKAVCRTKRTLPKSPSKRRAVVKKLLMEELPTAKVSVLFKEAAAKKIKDNPDETTTTVQEFYLKDYISRQQPGKRDCISVRDPTNNKRVIKQKKIMIMTILEAFQIFKNENPNVTIKKSKFFELRPSHVLPVSKTPHNVCICKYHGNMDYLVKCLSDAIDSFPKSPKELVSLLVCDVTEENCMMGKCDTCSVTSFYDKLSGLVDDHGTLLDKEFTWKQWKESESRVSVVIEEGTLEDVIHTMANQMQHYMRHCFVKRVQSLHFEGIKTSLQDKEDTVLLQVDFAENYSVLFQDEIQSAHWAHQQITIFTAVAWCKCGSKSLVVVSDETNHGKYAVWSFLSAIIKRLQQEYPQMKCLKIFTDGCAAQFKNKFTLTNLTFMIEEFGLTADWSFFATSHGKGAVDGVGATVKRAIWTRVKARNCEIQTAMDFAECASTIVKGITVLYISKEEIAGRGPYLDKRWDEVMPIQKLQSLHYFVPTNKGVLKVGATAQSEFHEAKVLPVIYQEHSVVGEDATADTVPVNITKGGFVEVLLTGRKNLTRLYVAEIMEFEPENNRVTLMYMEKSGNHWIWPKEADISVEDRSVVKKNLSVPKLVNNRGQFSFT